MSRLRWAFHRFKRISPRERKLLAEAVATMPCVHAMQQLLPFKRWRALLEQHEMPRTHALERPTTAQIAWAVGVAGRWLPGAYKCLPNAYTAHLLLHRYGYPSVIHVGVARDPQGKVEAHAWVDCEGRTVVGEVVDIGRFVPFPRLVPVRK